MPITTELQNVRELKAVGFSAPQAELFERSQNQGFEKFAEVLERRLGEINSRFDQLDVRLEAMETRIDGKIDRLRAEIYKALHDNNLKMMGAVIGIVSLAVAIIKLFPNAHP